MPAVVVLLLVPALEPEEAVALPKVKLGVVVVDPNEKLGALVGACDAGVVVVSPNLNVELDSSGFLAATVVVVSPKLLNAGKLLVDVSVAGLAGPASVLSVLRKDDVDND